MLATIQIVGTDRGVQAMMTRMEIALSPIRVAGFLQATVDPYIRTRAKNRFSSEGDDVSGKWFPLQEVTQRIRGDQGFGATGPINHRTGELEDYITGTPGGAVPNALGATLTSPGTPASGTLLTKVQTAQAGKAYPATVARPVMGVNEADMAAVVTDLAKYIVTGVLR